jgi:hypothetical protein
LNRLTEEDAESSITGNSVFKEHDDLRPDGLRSDVFDTQG